MMMTRLLGRLKSKIVEGRGVLLSETAAFSASSTAASSLC
jgi:hypothetical protein